MLKTLRAEYESIIRDLNITIKKLQKERDGFSFSRKEITRQWMEVLEDVRKEQEKEVRRLKKVIAELLGIIASLKDRNAELDEKRKKALKDYSFPLKQQVQRIPGENGAVRFRRDRRGALAICRDDKPLVM